MNKGLKTLSLASLAAICALGLVSCGPKLPEYEKVAYDYMSENADKYAQFDLKGGFTWSTQAAAVAYGCEKYIISYDFESDTGSLYMKSASGKEFEGSFSYTYDWEYNPENDAEEKGPSTFEWVEITKGTEEELGTDAGFMYGNLYAVSYKLEGTAIVAVQTAHAAATATETPAE